MKQYNAHEINVNLLARHLDIIFNDDIKVKFGSLQFKMTSKSSGKPVSAPSGLSKRFPM